MDEGAPGTLLGWGTTAEGSSSDPGASAEGRLERARHAEMAQAAATTRATTVMAAGRLRVYFAEQREQTVALSSEESPWMESGAPQERHDAGARGG